MKMAKNEIIAAAVATPNTHKQSSINISEDNNIVKTKR